MYFSILDLGVSLAWIQRLLHSKIKKDAYYELSKAYHPDNNETGDAKIFELIKNMYASISAEA